MEFLLVFAWNLAFSLIVVTANTFRSIWTPLGYPVILVKWVQGGVIWSTNSRRRPGGCRL